MREFYIVYREELRKCLITEHDKVFFGDEKKATFTYSKELWAACGHVYYDSLEDFQNKVSQVSLAAVFDESTKLSAEELNAKDEKGFTPLHRAVLQGDEKYTSWLISQGANVHALDKSEWTPLHLAATKKSDLIIHYLCNAGADVNAPGAGITPLQMAHYQYAPEYVARTLLHYGADPEILMNAADSEFNSAAFRVAKEFRDKKRESLPVLKPA